MPESRSCLKKKQMFPYFSKKYKINCRKFSTAKQHDFQDQKKPRGTGFFGK